MYELPEIETIRRDLDKEVSGKKVKAVEVSANASISRHKNRKEFTSALDGVKLGSVKRAGLIIYAELPEDQRLVLDISGGGRLRRHANKDETEKGTTVVITFTQGGQLRVVDPDGDADVFVTDAEGFAAAHPELERLGLDPVEQPISWTDFGRAVLPRDDKLKTLLTDPEFIVGLGPVYSDEILHAALLRGDRSASSLTRQEVRRLYRAVVETLHAALKYRGTTTGPDGYVDVFGEPGGYGEYLEVYGRVGERSRNGRGEVAKMKIGGQVHHYSEYQV